MTQAPIGMPEAQLTPAHATIHLATAPSVSHGALPRRCRPARLGLVPAHSRDGTLPSGGAGNAQATNTHDDPGWRQGPAHPGPTSWVRGYYRPTGRARTRDRVSAA